MGLQRCVWASIGIYDCLWVFGNVVAVYGYLCVFMSLVGAYGYL